MINSNKIILRPHITERASLLSESGVYAFEVTPGATKPAVMQAIRELYKVTPVKVRMVNLPAKVRTMRGKRGSTGGKRKAYVKLKSGDKIEFV